MSPSSRIEGLLLAAGESRRMGYPKPLLKVGGVTFLAKSAAAMLEVTERLIVVLGAKGERIAAALPHDRRILTVYNPNYTLGQLSSLQAGLEQVGPQAAAVIVHLADHPLVSAATFHLLVADYERSHWPIVITRYRGRRGHPVLFDRSIFSELIEAPQDQGARIVVNAEPARVGYVDVEDAGTVLDLDTPEDLIKAGLQPPPTS
ncbi:MAG TPA: nucleotidyltransferase family protein [Candidatus Binataceae bacterium]|nr:nucleotidyltransferase family protein [Candidatus Binataceae bacterium]